MTDKENPYRAPRSAFAQGRPRILSQAQQAVFANAMVLARRSALVFLAYASLVPILRWWQANNVLREYGAEHYVGTMLTGQLQREGPWLIALVLMAGLALKACRAIRHGNTDGPRQLAIACAGAIALDILTNAIELSSWPVAIVMRCAWCAYIIRAVIEAVKAGNAIAAASAGAAATPPQPSTTAPEIRPPAP